MMGHQLADLANQFQAHAFADGYKQRRSEGRLIAEAAVPEKVLHVHVLGDMLDSGPVSKRFQMLYDQGTDNKTGADGWTAFGAGKLPVVDRDNGIPGNEMGQANPTVIGIE